MTKLLALLALTGAASIQAQQPPAIAVIKTGWEQTAQNEYVYFGLPHPQLRQRFFEYSNKPVASVRLTPDKYWVYQYEGGQITPVTSRKAGMKAVKAIDDRK